MKKYYRPLKKYLTDEEIAEHERKHKKREKCRGGRDHDFRLVLPEYVKVEGEPTEEIVKEYYDTELKIREIVRNEEKRLASLGIIFVFGWWTRRLYKRYVCFRCGKKDYSIENYLTHSNFYDNDRQ